METETSSWWSLRTLLEKRLLVFCRVAAALVVVSLIATVKSNSRSSDSLCLSTECIAESAAVLRQMNLEADPCDDFYEFACGTFIRDTVIPDHEIAITASTVTEDEKMQQLRVIVQEPIHSNEIEPFQNIKRLYRACMNTSVIEDLGVTPARTAINNVGAWPVLESNWIEAAWTWPLSVQRCSENGYSVEYFMSFKVSPDDRNSSRTVIRIDQAKLGLERQYLVQNTTEPFVEAYRSYQVDLAVLFGADPIRATDEMMDALNFEIELARISLSQEERRDVEKLYNPMEVQQLQAKFNYVDHNWLTYFNSILPPECQLTANDTIIVGAVSFFEQLGNLLATTPKRITANYVAWRQAFATAKYLPRVFRERRLEYHRLVTGITDESPRWLECVEITLKNYPVAVGALYVRKHFDDVAKTMTLEMVNNIKEEFKIMLSEIEWMDESTKRSAKEKVEAIKAEVGYADELLNDEAVGKYYAAVPVVIYENEYHKSIRNLRIASARRKYMKLCRDVNEPSWSSDMTPTDANAYYYDERNLIFLPAGILKGAYFNPNRPQYMNYGGIGTLIGHEITHGFDDQGSQFDASGNLRNWWANATKDTFLVKAQCIINQYEEYVEPLTNLKLNGINTQAENIADNGAIKESYRAYKRVAENHSEQRMPGLDFTPQQMFWISAAQVWCSVDREKGMKDQVTTGEHSPERFRVNGPMSNMKEFSEDFHCKVATKMNPSTKCEVW